MKKINFKKKKMKLLTNKQKESYEKMQKSAIFVKKNLKINLQKIKNFVKLGTIVIIQENIEVLHIEHVI